MGRRSRLKELEKECLEQLPGRQVGSPPLRDLPEKLKAWIREVSGLPESKSRSRIAYQIHHASIPTSDGLEIHRNVDLSSDISSLPEGLSILGNLNMKRNTAMTVLPQSLVVTGTLNASGASKLYMLRKQNQVMGEFILNECHSLAVIPEGVTFTGSLTLSVCPRLYSLPDRFNVAGSLHIKNCKLESLPRHLVVGLDLYIKSCSKLSHLPSFVGPKGSENDGAKVARDVSLICCPQLSVLPNNMNVGGTLSIQYCGMLTSLSKGIHVQGDLKIDRTVRDLSEDLFVGAKLSLFVDSGQFTIPEGLFVGTKIELTVGSKASFAIQSRINALSCDIFIMFLQQVQAWDGEFRVKGDLCISSGPSLKALPNLLEVGGSLSIEKCLSLTSLPPSVSVQRDLKICDCPNFKHLGFILEHWSGPLLKVGAKHNITLENTSLSSNEIQQLRTMSSVVVSVTERQTPLLSALESLASCAKRKMPSIETELTAREETVVAEFLEKIRRSREFEAHYWRRPLLDRIHSTLSLLNDPQSFPAVITRMEDSLDACNDKPIWALNQMVVVSQILKARGSRERLKKLGKRIMHLMIVHEAARKRVKKTQDEIDDVCIYLSYEIKLRTVLNLPVPAVGMHYSTYEKISKGELAWIANTASLVSEQQFTAWLTSWSEWQRQDRLEAAQRLRWDQLPASSEDRAKIPEVDLSGEPLSDPVRVHGQIWSLQDVLTHWVRTGLSLMNANLSLDEVAHLHRITVY